MNFFDHMRDWFISATNYFVWLALDCYDLGWPLEGIGDWFANLSDWTSAIAGYLYDASDWYEYISNEVTRILNYGNIADFFQYWLDRAQWAWDWVNSAFWNVWDIANEWWTSTRYEVQTLIEIATEGLSALRAAWAVFSQVTLPSLVSFDWLETWWEDRLLDIGDLLDTAFTLRSDLWEGWQDWRDQVAEFFSDPEQWLYDRLDSFFERYW